LGQAVLVLRVGIGDVRFRFLKFGLAEFNNRAQTEIVAGVS
jgi:hypothetical protein